MKVAILGTGAWGTALGQVLADNGNDVFMWGVEKVQVNNINDGNMDTIFKGVNLPKNMHASMGIKEVVENARVIVIAVPTFAIKETCKKSLEYLKDKPYIVSVAKGFDPETEDYVSNTIRDSIPEELRTEITTLAGPSFAVEVLQRMPTAVTSASPDLGCSLFIQKLFSNKYFRVYSSNDEVGAEIAGAIKNVIAIASGALDGLGYSTNTRSLLITRGLLEMVRYSISQGGKSTTLYGLTGLGDLVLTCSSSESRNYRIGKLIGECNNASKVLKENKTTAEGVSACLILYKKIKQSNISMPICECIYKVLYEDLNPREAIKDLMNRPLRSEDI